MLALAAGCSRPRMTLCTESKAEIASATVKKYAFEAYPSWRADHRGQRCPASLDELNEYMNQKDDLDPWGTPYEMLCGDRIYIHSRGEDGIDDTDDDVWSYDGLVHLATYTLPLPR